MKSRREFIRNIGKTAATLSLFPISSDLLANVNPFLEEEIQSLSKNFDTENDFWAWVRHSYDLSPNMINLNNGGISPQPTLVKNALKRYLDICNENPSQYQFRIFKADVESVKINLSRIAGVSPKEIAITRNTTESLNVIVNGLPLAKGDEVILSQHEYPNIKNVWKMRAQRDGIVLKWADFPIPCEDDEQFIAAYRKVISNQTKVVQLTHMTNWTGQIIPVRKIADLAHKHGAEVIVDGAHSFAQLDFKIPELNCDYFGTSLHKWLGAPPGTGLLYIKSDKISNVWPTFASDLPQSDQIDKFESYGTHNIASKLAISHAISFHEAIGIQRKRQRLYQLKEYWVSQLENVSNITIHTPRSLDYSGSIATLSIQGITGRELNRILERDYRIHNSPTTLLHIDGIRISLNIYSSHAELDRMVNAIKTIAKQNE